MTNKIIDMHAHYLSIEYLDFLNKHGALLEDGFPLPNYDLNSHKELMDSLGIKYSLLSVSTPQPYFSDDENSSIKLCHQLNIQMANIKQNNKNFGYMGILPLPNVEASIKEAIYLLDEMNANGIKLASNSRGLYLGDEALDPLMEELNKRHALVTIHPHKPNPIKETVFSAGPVPLFEFLSDTTRAVLNLIGNNIILRYPNITWIVPHCGSFLPNIYDRFIGISKVLNNIDEEIVRESFKRLYYDLSGNPAPNLMKWLLTITDYSHLLYGSDFPFTPNDQIKNNLNKLLDILNDHKEDVLYNNAKELLKL